MTWQSLYELLFQSGPPYNQVLLEVILPIFVSQLVFEIAFRMVGGIRRDGKRNIVIKLLGVYFRLMFALMAIQFFRLIITF
jgi:hypothetical protein